MPKEHFTKSQNQFSHAVGYFSRNPAGLIARLPTSAQRAVLVHNLSDEHGLDEENPAQGFRPGLAHDRTFAGFLETLGVGADELAACAPEPPVRAFNLALPGACGFALIRQLNDSLDIPSLFGTLHWHHEEGRRLQLMDRSFFFPKILLASKP